MSYCSHEQKLQYDIQYEQFVKPMPLILNKIASLDLEAETVPQCSIERKILTHTNNVFEMLLCFPCLRLKQLNLDHFTYVDCGQLHTVLHPDLQVTNLCLAGCNLPDTASEDVGTLLKIPSLTRLIGRAGRYRL